MPSVKQMSLNQAYNLYKKATSFTEGINQLRKGNFTDTESLKLNRYDYSKAKNLIEYYNDTNSVVKSLFSSTLYNLAHISVKSGVIKEYEIDIQFDFEVNA